MESRKLLLLNGPNLNLLGRREPHIYGCETMEDISTELVLHAQTRGYQLDCFQSNHEGELIDRIQQVDTYAGIVLNPGAYMSYSYAIRDAISSVKTPVVEVHLSNIYARESFRHHSVMAAVVIGQVSGFGKNSYKLGLDAVIDYIERG